MDFTTYPPPSPRNRYGCIGFALTMMNVVLKMVNSVLKMMNYVLKMMNSVGMIESVGPLLTLRAPVHGPVSGFAPFSLHFASFYLHFTPFYLHFATFSLQFCSIFTPLLS